jgi:hypothetical protein
MTEAEAIANVTAARLALYLAAKKRRVLSLAMVKRAALIAQANADVVAARGALTAARSSARLLIYGF